MKRIVIVLSLLLASFVATSAIAADKVVVIPLNGASNGAFESITHSAAFGTASDNTITPTYEKLITLTSFTKVRSDTAVKVSWHSAVRQNGIVGKFVEYALRLSGQQSDGGDYTGVVVYQDNAEHREHINHWGYFAALPAGTYDVEIWIRGTSASTSFNTGSFRNQALVEEFLVKSIAPAAAPAAASALGTGIRGGVE